MLCSRAVVLKAAADALMDSSARHIYDQDGLLEILHEDLPGLLSTTLLPGKPNAAALMRANKSNCAAASQMAVPPFLAVMKNVTQGACTPFCVCFRFPSDSREHGFWHQGSQREALEIDCGTAGCISLLTESGDWEVGLEWGAAWLARNSNGPLAKDVASCMAMAFCSKAAAQLEAEPENAAAPVASLESGAAILQRHNCDHPELKQNIAQTLQVRHWPQEATYRCQRPPDQWPECS